MSYEVRWMRQARRQAAEVQRWWVANRELAPMMFRDELARVLGLLQQNPELGLLVRGREARRLLLPETKQFLYYRVRPRLRRIEVVALWSALRQFGPPLPPR